MSSLDDHKPKFEVDFLADYGDEALLNELRRVASELPAESILTKAAFAAHSPRTSQSTIQRRFGDWQLALERAGLGHRYSARSGKTVKTTSQVGKGKSKEQIVEELQRVHLVAGTDWLTTDAFNTHSVMEESVVRKRFGSFRLALEAAAIPSHPNAIRSIADEDCFANLATVWTSLARIPHYREMFASPSSIQGKTYVTRWGTWRRALIAFVEWTNESLATGSTRMSEPITAAEVGRGGERIAEEADRREVRPGLRFKVFKRDNFKCIACGRSPAMHIDVELHADHILAVANGGKSTFENLQTLCQVCNLGKGRS